MSCQMLEFVICKSCWITKTITTQGKVFFFTWKLVRHSCVIVQVKQPITSSACQAPFTSLPVQLV